MRVLFMKKAGANLEPCIALHDLFNVYPDHSSIYSDSQCAILI